MDSNNAVNSSQLIEQMTTAIPNEVHTVISADLGRLVAGVPCAIHGTRIFVFRRCHLHYAFTNARNFWIRWLPVSAT